MSGSLQIHRQLSGCGLSANYREHQMLAEQQEIQSQYIREHTWAAKC